MFQRPIFPLAAVCTIAALGAAAPLLRAPTLLQAPTLRDSDLGKLGDAFADYVEARRTNSGLTDAKEELDDTLEKLSKRAKQDLLSLPADIGRAWWLSAAYDKVRLSKGKVESEVYAGPFGEFAYAYWTPKTYNPRKQSYPIILCVPDVGQKPEDHLKEHWLASEILDNVVLLAPSMPADLADWKLVTKETDGQKAMGGVGNVLLALRVATDSFALDFDRIFVAGRGAGVETALALGDYAIDRFAGVIGRNGDAGEQDPRNFGNLPTYFAAAGARATTFHEKAQAMGYDNVTLQPDATEADVWAWMQEHPRQPYPTEVVFYPGERNTRSYWLQVPPTATADAKISARIDSETNKVSIESQSVAQVSIYFNDVLLDLDKPIQVECNGVLNEVRVPRSLDTTLDLLFNAKSDPGRVFVAADTFSIPAPPAAEK